MPSCSLDLSRDWMAFGVSFVQCFFTKVFPVLSPFIIVFFSV